MVLSFRWLIRTKLEILNFPGNQLLRDGGIENALFLSIPALTVIGIEILSTRIVEGTNNFII